MNINAENRINMAKEIEGIVKNYFSEHWTERYKLRIEDGKNNVVGFYSKADDLESKMVKECVNEILNIVESKIENRIQDMLMEDILKDFRENRGDVTEVIDIKSSGRYKLIAEEDNDYVTKTTAREGSGEAHIIMVYEV